MLNKTFFTLLCIGLASFLGAEVDYVTISWTPEVCIESCGQGLKRYLSEIPEVSNVEINLAAGTARMLWKPNHQFSFQPINTATRVIGIPRILNSRIKVRGTISSSGDTYNLLSIGDNTPFLLLGPIQPNPAQYTITTSIYSHPLSQEMQNRLRDIERKRQVVAIEGTLFEPVRQISPVIIVEKLTVEEKTKG